jgi:hypothetical protein
MQKAPFFKKSFKVKISPKDKKEKGKKRKNKLKFEKVKRLRTRPEKRPKYHIKKTFF